LAIDPRAYARGFTLPPASDSGVKVLPHCPASQAALNLSTYENKLTGANEMSHRIVFCLLLFLIIPALTEAKSWNGITPLKSNREDVARTLNLPLDARDKDLKYESPAETVRFTFSGREEYLNDCVKKLPLGTVLLIEITPKTALRLIDLGLEESKLREMDSSPDFLIDGQAYSDEREGAVFTLSNGYVRKIVYTASSQDRYLCPTYYEEPRLFADRILCRLCPTVAVTCPDDTEAGTAITFTANTAVGSPPQKLTFHWTVSAGTIIEGQSTDSIKVDTKNLGGKTVTATVEVDGFDPECNKTASCSTPIVPRKY